MGPPLFGLSYRCYLGIVNQRQGKSAGVFERFLSVYWGRCLVVVFLGAEGVALCLLFFPLQGLVAKGGFLLVVVLGGAALARGGGEEVVETACCENFLLDLLGDFWVLF